MFFYLMFLMDVLVSIKEINSQTFTIEKIWRSQNFDFLGKKIWRNGLALKGRRKMVEVIFGETFILALHWLAKF